MDKKNIRGIAFEENRPVPLIGNLLSKKENQTIPPKSPHLPRRTASFDLTRYHSEKQTAAYSKKKPSRLMNTGLSLIHPDALKTQSDDHIVLEDVSTPRYG